MGTIKKILIVIDPTALKQPALERVARLPRPLNAQLKLVICDYEPNLGIGLKLAPAAVASARSSLILQHEKALGALANRLRKEGLDVLTDVRWDYPLHEAIIRAASEWGADLVVKDTHHHSVLKRSIFSNTDWNLIRDCPTQLLLVKPRAIGHVPVVVAAVDPLHPRDKTASLDDRIVRSAQELAAMVGGHTLLLHGFDITPIIASSAAAMMMATALPIGDITAEMERHHTEAVRSLAHAHGIPNERVHVLQGGIRDLLLGATDRLHADVIVMGAVSRSALERLFIGSTAEAVLDKLACDVLIVKPESFKLRVAGGA
jgi:universal stress protein E